MEAQNQDLEEDLELDLNIEHTGSAQNFVFFIMTIIILGLNLFVRR